MYVNRTESGDSIEAIAVPAPGPERRGEPSWIGAPRELDRMIRRLDFASMRSLEAVCEHGSISRAAQAESLTASAISKRIRELEGVLGTELLRRSHDGIRPSRAGRMVLQHWVEIKTRMYTLAESVRSMPSDGDARLALVCDERLFDFLCVDLFSRPDLFELARQVDVVPTSRDVDDTLASLEADIGIALAGPGDDAAARGAVHAIDGEPAHVRVAPTAYVAILRRHHPLAGQPSLTAAALAPYPVWPLGGTRRLLPAIEAAAGGTLCTDRTPRWLRLSNALSILDAVALDAVVLAPVSIRWQCPRFPNISVVELNEAWSRVDLDITVRTTSPRRRAALETVRRIFC